MFTNVLERTARFGATLSSPLPVDAFARLLDPLWSSTVCRARVTHIMRETPDAASIVLRPGRGWESHQAGQWIAVGVDIDGVRHRRPYSLTSVPVRADGCITITVQAVPDGVVSNFLVHQLQVGEIVHLDPPNGDFTLGSHSSSPLLFITGGSGVTPVMGMLRTLDAADVALDAVHLHYAASPDQAIFADELRRLAVRHSGFGFKFGATGTGPIAPELALTTRRLDALCPDWSARETWICGPAPLLAAAEAIWESAGISDQLHSERFQPSLTATNGTKAGIVQFLGSGVETPGDGIRPLLELAEEAGLSPKHGCRMGICHTCVVRLNSGSVLDLRDGRIQSDEGDFVQICVSAPCGDVSLEL